MQSVWDSLGRQTINRHQKYPSKRLQLHNCFVFFSGFCFFSSASKLANPSTSNKRLNKISANVWIKSMVLGVDFQKPLSEWCTWQVWEWLVLQIPPAGLYLPCWKLIKYDWIGKRMCTKPAGQVDYSDGEWQRQRSDNAKIISVKPFNRFISLVKN